MRLVIDLQGAQGDNRARGIGRYARELARAMAAAPRGHDIHILLNAALPTEPLRATLASTLPARALHLWHAPAATAALHARLGLRDGYVLFLGGGDIRKNEPGLIQT